MWSWVAFGLLVTTLQLSKLSQFLFLTPLLFRVNVCSNALSRLLVLRRNYRLIILSCRSCHWLLLSSCRHSPTGGLSLRSLIGCSKGLLFLPNEFQSLLFLLLTGLNGEPDHFLFFLSCTVGLFLRSLRHLNCQSHLLIDVIAASSNGPFNLSRRLARRLGISDWLSSALLLHESLHSGLVDLHILLNHHLLERLKVINRKDLLDNSIVSGIASTLFTRSLELLSSDTHFSDKLAQKLIDKFEEILK